MGKFLSTCSFITSACLAVVMLAGAASAQSTPVSTDAGMIAKGKYLATAGDCVACHTAPGGKPFAGGLALQSPFGKIYSPNITPDKATGIGDWSDDDFYRAMHDGIGKAGQYLYPAFPFPWYTKVTRDDALAIKAYLFSLPPVNQPDKPLAFSFPFDIREGLLAWRTAFFKNDTFQPDPSKSAQLNRGAYLVESLGHCGECHNRDNLMGASDWSGRLKGGKINGWYAPALIADRRQGIGGWSEDDLVSYLKTGAAPGKGVVVGPMQQTIQDSLSQLTDADLHAIAVYLQSIPADQPAKPDAASAVPAPQGGNAYLTHCGFCHLPTGKGQGSAIPALAGNATVNATGAENLIRVVLGGLPATHGYAPMPAVGAGMTDNEVAAAVNYVRQSWGNRAPATLDGVSIGKYRNDTKTVMALNLPGGCEKVDDPALAKAVAEPDVTSVLADHNHPLLDRIDDVIAKVKQAAPKAAGDQIVNALIDAYCPVVMADQSKSYPDRVADLGNFSGLVYGRINKRPARG